MDPDANLQEQLKLAESINTLVEDRGVLTEDDVSALEEQATRLAELVAALDGWLADGNFLPGRWKYGRGYHK